MSDFNKDEYLNDLPDMDDLSGQAAPAAASAADGASADRKSTRLNSSH